MLGSCCSISVLPVQQVNEKCAKGKAYVRHNNNNNNNNTPFMHSTTPSAKAEALRSISLPVEQFNFKFSERNNRFLSDTRLQNPERPNVAEKLPVVKPLEQHQEKNKPKKTKNKKLKSENLKRLHCSKNT